MIYSLSITDGLMFVTYIRYFLCGIKGAVAIFLTSDGRKVTMNLLVNLAKKAGQSKKKTLKFVGAMKKN